MQRDFRAPAEWGLPAEAPTMSAKTKNDSPLSRHLLTHSSAANDVPAHRVLHTYVLESYGGRCGRPVADVPGAGIYTNVHVEHAFRTRPEPGTNDVMLYRKELKKAV